MSENFLEIIRVNDDNDRELLNIELLHCREPILIIKNTENGVDKATVKLYGKNNLYSADIPLIDFIKALDDIKQWLLEMNQNL